MNAPAPGIMSRTWTMRSGFSYARGRSSTEFTTLNMVVFAPIPRASVSSASAVNPGDLRSIRKPKRASFSMGVGGRLAHLAHLLGNLANAAQRRGNQPQHRQCDTAHACRERRANADILR